MMGLAGLVPGTEHTQPHLFSYSKKQWCSTGLENISWKQEYTRFYESVNIIKQIMLSLMDSTVGSGESLVHQGVWLQAWTPNFDLSVLLSGRREAVLLNYSLTFVHMCALVQKLNRMIIKTITLKPMFCFILFKPLASVKKIRNVAFCLFVIIRVIFPCSVITCTSNGICLLFMKWLTNQQELACMTFFLSSW